MIKAYKKFFIFSARYKREWKKAIMLEILNSILLSLQFPAIMVMLASVLSDSPRPIWAFAAFGIMLVRLIGSIVCRQSIHTKEGIASYRTCGDKRIEIGERLKYMPMGFFGGHSLGNITAVATTTMDDLQAMAMAVIVRTLNGVIHTIVLALCMCVFNLWVGIIILLGTLIFILLNGALLKKSETASPIRLAAQAKLVDAVLEYIQGMGVVKAFHLMKDASSHLERTINETERENLKVERLAIPYTAAESAVLHIAAVAVVFVTIALFLSGQLALSVSLMIIMSAYMMFNLLLSAGKMFVMMPFIIASIDRVEAVSKSPSMDVDGAELSPSSFEIKLKNVCFGYGDTQIIKDVSLTIPQNTTTAIVGASGSGKTTLCNLMARFWDVDSGSIMLGGHDVREYSLDSLLKNFSMVFQNVYLFNDTIENNIKFGKPDATRSEVAEAAKQACCHDFIAALPEGYDTVLGEGGATVSGGEKQRISIARAILKNAPIIILDEATANVDPENENLLADAISSLTRNKTVIMIAHRMKTVKNADKIIVLDGGRIVQQGQHDELMAQEGIYSRFVMERQQAESWQFASPDLTKTTAAGGKA